MPTDDTTSAFDRRRDAVAIVSRLREAGHVAYFAGGCVRDELLGLIPKDYDVATDAPPARMRAIFPRTQAVGAAFGVILVRQGSSVIEVATFRTDGTYSDGRHPDSVAFGSPEQDAQRRDFTINGLFLDPLDPAAGSPGRVIDFVNGQRDLADRVLRAIGAPTQRLEEDYLRLLRAVRFAARFGLTVEPETWQAILRVTPRLMQISPERIAEELRLMLAPPTRRAAWAMLRSSGLAAVVLRGVADQPFAGTTAVFDRLPGADEPVSFPLALAAGALEASAGLGLASALSPDRVRRAISGLRRTLRLSNDETDALHSILGLFVVIDPTAPPPTVARMKRFLARPTAPDARRLMEAIASADPSGPLVERIREVQPHLARLEQAGDIAPPPLVTGDDLVAAGLAPGPRFRRMLEAAYDEQLEGRLQTREQALTFAMAVP